MKRRRAKNKAKKTVAKSNTDNISSSAKKSRINSLDKKIEEEKVKSDIQEKSDEAKKSLPSTLNDNGMNSKSTYCSITTPKANKVTQQTDQYSNESFSNEDTTSSSISTNSNEINLVKSGNNSNKSNYLFIELKLISIDAKCVDYTPLEQRFLCIESDGSLTRHIEKFIINKMKLNNELFEVSLLDH